MRICTSENGTAGFLRTAVNWLKWACRQKSTWTNPGGATFCRMATSIGTSEQVGVFSTYLGISCKLGQFLKRNFGDDPRCKHLIGYIDVRLSD